MIRHLLLRREGSPTSLAPELEACPACHGGAPEVPEVALTRGPEAAAALVEVLTPGDVQLTDRLSELWIERALGQLPKHLSSLLLRQLGDADMPEHAVLELATPAQVPEANSSTVAPLCLHLLLHLSPLFCTGLHAARPTASAAALRATLREL